MSKWYRKRRSYRKRNSAKGTAALIFLAMVFLYQYWYIFLPTAVGIGICVLAWYLIKRNMQKDHDWITDRTTSNSNNCGAPAGNATPIYSAKESIMTDCEKAFFKAFQEIATPNYTVQPQINLASIIDKETQSRYRNELFRNIDFGIFDKSYSLLLLIEINDQSHNQRERMARDRKVHAICEKAGIPIITFWTKYGINEQYIYNRLSTYLPLLSIPANRTDSNNGRQNDCVSYEENVHNMKLNPRPFGMIKSGQKTIEMRLFDEKRQQFKAGDKIIFTNNDTGETLNSRIIKMHHFDTFEELYHSLPLLQCGYTAEEIEKASPTDMEQYYSVEQQKKYGVVGIELFLSTDESVV